MMKLLQYILVLAFTCFSLSIFAQKRQSDYERELKAEKVTFITNKLSLTTDEAKLFWPIYDSYWDRKNKILSERKRFVDEFGKDLDKLSEADLVAYTNRYVNYYKQETDLLVDLNNQLKSIISPKKILLLYQANYEFKSYLLQKVKESGKDAKN